MKLLSRDIRAKLIRLAAILCFVYLLAIALLVLGETSMVYLPREGPSDPAKITDIGPYTAKTLTIEGQSPIVYWENDAPVDAPTVIYFHGNAGGLYLHKNALRFFNEAKLHAIGMEYPGYPGNPGDPSEMLIVNQAIALFDAVASKEQRPPAVWGYSLGSGVAVQLAARRNPSVVILEAPYMGIDVRAEELFPYAPIRHLMTNQYRSRDYIKDIHSPLFIMHGTQDQIIPIHHGKALFDLANQPKSFKEYQSLGHLNLFQSDAYNDAAAFLRTYTEPLPEELSAPEPSADQLALPKPTVKLHKQSLIPEAALEPKAAPQSQTATAPSAGLHIPRYEAPGLKLKSGPIPSLARHKQPDGGQN